MTHIFVAREVLTQVFIASEVLTQVFIASEVLTQVFIASEVLTPESSSLSFGGLCVSLSTSSSSSGGLYVCLSLFCSGKTVAENEEVEPQYRSPDAVLGHVGAMLALHFLLLHATGGKIYFKNHASYYHLTSCTYDTEVFTQPVMIRSMLCLERWRHRPGLCPCHARPTDPVMVRVTW